MTARMPLGAKIPGKVGKCREKSTLRDGFPVFLLKHQKFGSGPISYHQVPKMGRRPSSMASKRVNGTTDKDSTARRPEVEELPPGRPECPPHLVGRSKKAFNQVCDLLGDLGCLTVADGPVIAVYAAAFGQYCAAADQLKKEGTTIVRHGGIFAHPAVAERDKSQSMMVRVLAELGLTPSARPRLTPAAKPDETSERWGNVLKRA